MKTKSQISPFLPRLFTSAIVASLSIAGHASAADVTWDITAGDGIVTGGTGIWDTNPGKWTTDAGLNNVAWNNDNNDVALFGDVPGTVTIAPPVTAAGLVFNAAGYSVTGGNLTLTGAANVTVGSGLNAAISSVIDGTAGLVAGTATTGTGTVTLAGANLFTGATLVNAGTVNIQNAGAFGGTAEGTTVANGAGLSIEGGVQVLGESLGIRGAGVGNAGGIRNISGNNSWTGLITLTNSLRVTSNSGTLTLGSVAIAQRLFIMTGPGNITVEGDITGTSGSVQVDNLANEGIAGGTMTLKGANVFTGTTTVTNGVLNLEGNRTSDSGAITVGNGDAQTGTLNFKNGNFTTTPAASIVVGDLKGTGIVNHTVGTLSTALQGTGFLLVGGGVDSIGTYNLSGGALLARANNSNAFILGANTGSVGAFNLSGTGSLTMNSGASAIFQIGRCFSSGATTSSTGTFNQSGGTALFRNIAMGGGTNNSGTISKLNLTGGTFSVNLAFSGLSAGAGSSSEIIIGGNAVVTLPAFPTARGSGSTATLTFDGGTLRPTAASTAYIGGLDSATIQDGGVTFDVPSGRDILITQPLLTHGSSLGGGLTKVGLGTLALSGANSYTGPTAVSQGALGLAGSMTSPVTVASGAFLGFDLASATATSTGSVTLEDGAKVRILGMPSLASYTLMTASSFMVSPGPNPVLEVPIAGYELVIDGNALKLNSIAASGYDTWAEDNMIDGGPDGLPDGDFDKDGILNLVEYALGLDPRVSSGSPGVVSNNGMTITFTKGAEAKVNGDVDYMIETSTTLGVAPSPWTDAVAPALVETVDTISIMFPTGPSKNFARLKVEQTP